MAASIIAVFTGVAYGAATTQRVSVRSDGSGIDALSDGFPVMSADGNLVAFESKGRLTGGDDGRDYDVFVHNRATGLTARVSLRSNGTEVQGANSLSPRISGSGRFVAFQSDGGLTGHGGGIFLRDRRKGKTSQIARGSGISGLSLSGISANGQYVVFDSNRAFKPADTDTKPDVFVRDRSSRAVYEISVRSDGSQVRADCRTAGPLSISRDGRFVVFESRGQFTPGDPSGDDLFVRDRVAGTTERLAVGPNGLSPNDLGRPLISANGRYVAFTSHAALLLIDTNGTDDAYVFDRDTDMVALASVKTGGAQLPDRSIATSISGDGRYVLFVSQGPFTADDTNGRYDVFIHDMTTNDTTRASLGGNGGEVAADAGYARFGGIDHDHAGISADGRFAAFVSNAPFTPNDSGPYFDVFERGPLF
jgi:TolB protein